MRTLACAALLLVACAERAAPAPQAAPAAQPPTPPQPQPEATAAPADPSAAITCARTEDCVLVRSGCNGATVVNETSAPALRAEHAAWMQTARCASTEVDAVTFVCGGTDEERRCMMTPEAHPEARRCGADSDCRAMDWGCQWTAAGRGDEATLRAAFPTGPGCPGIMPQPPRARCTELGFCVLATTP